MITYKNKISINITPLIDIILIFLFLFFYLYKKESKKYFDVSKIDLIEKKNIEENIEVNNNKKIYVKIQKNKEIFINKKKVNLSDLAVFLKKMIIKLPAFTIFLSVDQNLAIQFLLDVYAIFEKLNCENQVVLLVKHMD